MTTTIDQAKQLARDVRITPVQARGVLELAEAIERDAPGPDALARFRIAFLEAHAEATRMG